MAARKKIWDLEADGGPKEVEMWATDADDAARHDPDRWTYEAPDGSAGAVEIPNDWADLPNSKRRGLALRLGAINTIKVTEVNGFIEAEIERRATLKQPVEQPVA
jgi:hypothetical protein